MKLKVALLAVAVSALSFAQPGPPPGPPPSYPPADLDRTVQRVALYPDSLLAQVLSAATFYDQIPDAARWSDEHHYLQGDALANAIQSDQLPWDPSVQALLPFPSVLTMMAGDMNWTQELGNAVLAERPAVMDAVQRQRSLAMQYGYLRTGPQVTVVRTGPYIAIDAVNPGYVYVPYYDPAIVFFPPRPGFRVGLGINFGFGFNLGVAFRPWGWGPGLARIDWAGHGWYFHNAVWGRTWGNRFTYVHPYPAGFRRFDRPGPYVAARPGAVPHPESHQLEQRSVKEREADRTGARRAEEHDRR